MPDTKTLRFSFRLLSLWRYRVFTRFFAGAAVGTAVATATLNLHGFKFWSPRLILCFLRRAQTQRCSGAAASAFQDRRFMARRPQWHLMRASSVETQGFGLGGGFAVFGFLTHCAHS